MKTGLITSISRPQDARPSGRARTGLKRLHVAEMVEVKGFEPIYPACKASVLPLNDTPKSYPTPDSYRLMPHAAQMRPS